MENKAPVTNRKVFIYVAIILLVLFIVSIVALNVFKFAKGGDTPTPTYYSYKIDNSNVPEGPHLEPDEKSFIINTNIKYHEIITFHATNSASPGMPGHPDHYIFRGEGLSFTLSIEDETYCLSSVIVNKIMISDTDPGDIYQLNEYEAEYSSESKSYKVTLNNTEVRYIHSIELKYAVGKK